MPTVLVNLIQEAPDFGQEAVFARQYIVLPKRGLSDKSSSMAPGAWNLIVAFLTADPGGLLLGGQTWLGTPTPPGSRLRRRIVQEWLVPDHNFTSAH